METDRLYFLGFQNHCSDCSHEIKRRLPFGKTAMTNLDSILKSRDINFATKVCIVKAIIIPIVMYGCESWTIKKPEWWRIDAFKLWCWRRLLRVPWTARRSNQWILKEINPEFSLEGLLLKLQYFGHLIQRGQRSKVWCSPRGHKELDTTEWVNNSNFLTHSQPPLSKCEQT